MQSANLKRNECKFVVARTESVAASDKNAFVTAHAIAVLGLVTGDLLPDAITKETYPEVLWLDQHRLTVAREEFGYGAGQHGYDCEVVAGCRRRSCH